MPNLKGQVKHQKPNWGFYKHNLDLKTSGAPMYLPYIGSGRYSPRLLPSVHR